jgi:hypothetical protein
VIPNAREATALLWVCPANAGHAVVDAGFEQSHSFTDTLRGLELQLIMHARGYS